MSRIERHRSKHRRWNKFEYMESREREERLERLAEMDGRNPAERRPGDLSRNIYRPKKPGFFRTLFPRREPAIDPARLLREYLEDKIDELNRKAEEEYEKDCTNGIGTQLWDKAETLGELQDEVDEIFGQNKKGE